MGGTGVRGGRVGRTLLGDAALSCCQGISCNYCFDALEILERSRLIYSDVLFTLLCSSPARESFQNNPRWQHCCFSYYCLALSLNILLEGCRVLGLFDFAEIFGKNDKKR